MNNFSFFLQNHYCMQHAFNHIKTIPFSALIIETTTLENCTKCEIKSFSLMMLVSQQHHLKAGANECLR